MLLLLPTMHHAVGVNASDPGDPQVAMDLPGPTWRCVWRVVLRLNSAIPCPIRTTCLELRALRAAELETLSGPNLEIRAESMKATPFLPLFKMSSLPPLTPPSHKLELPDLPPTLRDFFPLHDAVETDTDIRRDVALLSALLKDYRPGKSTGKQGRSSSHSDLWSHLAYTLVPGSSDDPTGNEVVAVVGRIEPGSILATVARNTSPKFTPVRRENPVEVDRVAVHPHDNVRKMLQNPLTPQ